MERKIIKGTYRDYIFLFGDRRTTYSDLSAKRSAAEKNLYIMIEDNMPAGYICVNFEENLFKVNYAYTVPEKRCHGVFTELLKHLTELADGYEVLITIPERQKNFDSIVKICKSLGFSQDGILKIFRTNWAAMRDWKENYFDKFMETQGHKYLEYFSRRNFKTYSFNDAPQKYLEQLYHSQENFFENPFEVKNFFDGSYKNFVAKDLSFIAVKNDKLSAYYLITFSDDKNIFVGQTAVAKEYLNSGLMFILCDKVIRAIYDRKCESLTFAVYSDNLPALKFDAKVTRNLKFIESRSYEYLFV